MGSLPIYIIKYKYTVNKIEYKGRSQSHLKFCFDICNIGDEIAISYDKNNLISIQNYISENNEGCDFYLTQGYGIII